MSYPDFTTQMPQQPMQQQMMQPQMPWYSQQWQNPYANPYRQQLQQQPQIPQQPQSQNSNLSGRFVSNSNEIAVNEVDMNGSVSVFPMNDMSCIYAKQWTADGKIQTVKYIPMQEETATKSNEAVSQPLQIDYAPFMERFDRLEQLLTPKTASRAKKGDVENE